MGAVEYGTWVDGRRPQSPELLPGEMPASEMFEDAELWITVYSELLAFLDGHPETRVFQPTTERYRRRLAYWRRRLDELSAEFGADPREGSGNVG